MKMNYNCLKHTESDLVQVMVSWFYISCNNRNESSWSASET